LREDGGDHQREEIHGDSPCVEMIRHETSRNCGTNGEIAELVDTEVIRGSRVGAPTTADEALRLAIKLAVDAADYERAGALIDVAKRTLRRA
jgi:hypothetical protein